MSLAPSKPLQFVESVIFARTVLLGDREEIERIAEQQGVQLNDNVEIHDPKPSSPKLYCAYG